MGVTDFVSEIKRVEKYPYVQVAVHLQTDHFVEILIFGLMYRSKHELSSKKKTLKTIKYWQRNGGFKFWPELKKVLIFGLMYRSKHELSSKKKTLKTIKYWQRNGGFKFWPEVKITRLIDIFSAVFSNQFFHLKRTLKKSKTHREFVRLPPNFDSG